jgi:HK97 family phage portal protein
MFLSLFNGAVRNASAGGDRSPWGSFWFEPVGNRSSTGLRITSVAAMRLSAVYSCVRVLSETFAVLPFCLYRQRADGGRDRVTDHWLYQLLAKRPNDWQTPFEWREMMMGHLCLRGNAFNELVANGAGQVTDLLPIHPDQIKAQRLDNGDYNYLVTMSDGTKRTLSRGQVWHIRGLSSDGVVGLNPIEVATDVLGLGVAAQTYGARFFANDAKPGGWIELPGKFADNAARDSFKGQWKAAQSGSNRGATAVLENGMKYNELTLNNSDAQFLESRKFSRSEIASLFRVPPHLIGDLEKATFSNIEQQSLDFVMHTMTPWAERWESSIETVLAFDDEGLEVEFDFSALLRGDRAARQLYLHGMVLDGILTRNEARISEGYNPLEGLDEPLRPLNMTTEADATAAQEKLMQEVPEPAPAPAPAGGQGAPPDESADARAVALIRSAAERVARKEMQVVKAAFKAADIDVALAEAYAGLVPFVAVCLALSDQAAAAYCEHRRTQLIRGVEEADFMATALSTLERLALKGSME